MNAPVSPPLQAPPLDFDRLTEKYIALRDKIREIEARQKDEIKPYKETLEKLSNIILDHLNKVGGDGVRTKHGTVSRTTKWSATIADMSAFWDWVKRTESWDMIDKKANVTACRDFIETKKAPVPGVNVSSYPSLNVRRA